MSDISRHDKIQRLDKSHGLDPYYSRHEHDDLLWQDRGIIHTVVCLMLGMILGMLLLSGLRACDPVAAYSSPLVSAVGVR